ALRQAIRKALEHSHGTLTVLLGLTQAIDGTTLEQRRAAGVRADTPALHFSVNRACPSCGTSFPEPDPRLFSYNSKHGWCTGCYGTGVHLAGFDADQTGEESAWKEGGTAAQTCTTCQGERLNPV